MFCILSVTESSRELDRGRGSRYFIKSNVQISMYMGYYHCMGYMGGGGGVAVDFYQY